MNDSVNRIDTTRDSLYAFEITGEVSDDAMERMAKTMNDAFDHHDDKVDMLLIFRAFEGSEPGATLDMDVIASRLRSLTNVARYCVVGAPESANTMIETMAKLMPVEAHTFALHELDAAWTLLGAQPVVATA